MSNLVPIPWQPGYYLTPDTLAYLIAAGNKLQGTQLRVTDAWRSYAEQKYYWDKYVAYLNGGPYAPPASNPDTGQRNHMRGAAFDLERTDATVQAACKAVGLIRDADESWHWNNPNAASMPIIPTNNTTTTGGGGSTPIKPPIAPLTKEEKEMLKFWKTVSKRQYWGAYLFGAGGDKNGAAKYGVAARYAKLDGTVGSQDTFNAVQEQWILEMLAANGIKK